MRWLITNRNLDGTDGFGCDLAPLTFGTFDPATVKTGAQLSLRSSWTQRTLD